MREAVEAWAAVADALRDVEDARERQVRVERSRRPIPGRRLLIEELERERRVCEHDLELCLLDLLQACGMVDDQGRDARAKNARLRSATIMLIENA